MSPSLITEESLTKWGEGVANCCFCYVKEYHVEESWFVKGYRAEGFGGVRDILDRPRWGGQCPFVPDWEDVLFAQLMFVFFFSGGGGL